ncbi:siderophore-interacting protein [Herbiconiux sp. YIM B11900]|uniref:siderophore-interacting protein n=1 Tax=Herbiconiux sp. YIM B11900 TaxID=3404131 RepID=UPI003F82940D
MTIPSARPARPQTTLHVISREQLSPHLVRLVLGGEQFGSFTDNGHTDKYVKIFFAKPELGLAPPYDIEALRETLAPEDLPVTRTYTVRAVDPVARTLSIDFVVHGDEGLAGPWARDAEPGDEITFRGPGGAFSPKPEFDWYLFAGDLSALPAIAAALEALPAGATGLAFVTVSSEDDILPLEAPEGVTVNWLVRSPEDDDASGNGDDDSDDSDSSATTDPTLDLAVAIAAEPWPEGRPQVFAHGERTAMKALRNLFKERGITRDQLSLSGYWALGRTEDRFQAEKREPIGVIEPV